jgi:hypothetical protein
LSLFSPVTSRTKRQKPLTAPGGIRSRPSNGWRISKLPANTPMDPRYLNEDFREFLRCLNAAGVEYLLIGGHAVAYHGYVRPTTEMDVWIAMDRANAEKAVAAVRKFFGTEMKGLSPEWFLDPENVSRFGVRPFLIEILTHIDGGDFKTAFARHIEAEINGVRTKLITLDDLKASKRASGRNKDLADLDNLP